MCVTPCILSVWSVQGGQGGQKQRKQAGGQKVQRIIFNIN